MDDLGAKATRRGLAADEVAAIVGVSLLAGSSMFPWISAELAVFSIEAGAFSKPAWLAVSIGAVAAVLAFVPRLRSTPGGSPWAGYLGATALMPVGYVIYGLVESNRALDDVEMEARRLFDMTASVRPGPGLVLAAAGALAFAFSVVFAKDPGRMLGVLVVASAALAAGALLAARQSAVTDGSDAAVSSPNEALSEYDRRFVGSLEESWARMSSSGRRGICNQVAADGLTSTARYIWAEAGELGSVELIEDHLARVC